MMHADKDSIIIENPGLNLVLAIARMYGIEEEIAKNYYPTVKKGNESTFDYYMTYHDHIDVLFKVMLEKNKIVDTVRDILLKKGLSNEIVEKTISKIHDIYATSNFNVGGCVIENILHDCKILDEFLNFFNPTINDYASAGACLSSDLKKFHFEIRYCFSRKLLVNDILNIINKMGAVKERG